jgi:hypothetical protein
MNTFSSRKSKVILFLFKRKTGIFHRFPKNSYLCTQSPTDMLQLPSDTPKKLHTACQILDELLKFLQAHKIPQRTIATIAGAGNLSKLRSPTHLSPSYNPQKIVAVINNILAHYQISYQLLPTAPYTCTFEATHLQTTAAPNQTLYHAYYYYSQIEQKVLCAQLTTAIAERPTAVLTFYVDQQPVHTYPPAAVNTTSNHLVLHFQNDKHFVALAILYCAHHRWQDLPLLLGTYTGIRQRDSKPVCGRLVLQRFATHEQFLQHLHQPVPPAIAQWLHEKSDETPNRVVFDLQKWHI